MSRLWCVLVDGSVSSTGELWVEADYPVVDPQGNLLVQVYDHSAMEPFNKVVVPDRKWTAVIQADDQSGERLGTPRFRKPRET